MGLFFVMGVWVFCLFLIYKLERGKKLFQDLSNYRKYFVMPSINTQPCFYLFFSSDEAMRKAGVAHNKSSKDMESHVFMKAKTRVKHPYLLPEVIGCQKKFGTNCRNSKASALKNTELFEILIYMCCFFYLEGR